MKQKIDLAGSEGNAYVLLGYAVGYSKKRGLDVEAVQQEMKAGDYENLLNVFLKYFGQYVTLKNRKRK